MKILMIISFLGALSLSTMADQQLVATNTTKTSQATSKKEEKKKNSKKENKEKEKVKEEEREEEEIYTPAKLSVGTTLSLMNYDVSDSSLSSELESDLVYGVVAQGEFPLTEDLFLDLGIQYKKIKFEAPQGKSLSTAGDSFFDFTFGLAKHWEGFSIGAGFHYGQDPLTISMNNSSLAMKSFQVFSPYLKTRYRLYSAEKTSMAIELIGRYNLKSKTDQFELEKGYNGIVNFDIERTLDKESSLSFVPFVNYQKKELGTLTLKGTETGVKVVYNLLD